jgi:hypothetical protein
MAMRCWVLKCAIGLELVLAALAARVLTPMPVAPLCFFLHKYGQVYSSLSDCASILDKYHHIGVH